MKSELISVSVLETTSAAGAIVSFIEQVEPILRFVAAGIAIISGIISIILAVAHKGKKAAADGKITADEVLDIAQDVADGAKQIEEKIEKIKKEPEWAERKE